MEHDKVQALRLRVARIIGVRDAVDRLGQAAGRLNSVITRKGYDRESETLENKDVVGVVTGTRR